VAKESLDFLVVEGTLSRDSSGNLTLSNGTNANFQKTGYYRNDCNGDSKLAEYAIKKGKKIGDKVTYVCVLQPEE
jgi:hypothetical protein